MHENRETSAVSRFDRDRSEKVLSRTADVYAAEESDHAVVPVNQPNKGRRLSAEVGEGRAWRKENVVRSSTSPTLSGTTRVPRARRRAKGHCLFVIHPSEEPRALAARARICAGGAG
jgi:hypothetical protein